MIINNLQHGRTSLHKAAEYGHTDVVKTLISHGGDIFAKDNVSECFMS